jgi:import receptor subunit TOM70
MPPTPTASSLHPGDAEANSLVERVQDFVSEHKKTILIATAAAVVAVAGFAYLQYASASAEKEPRSR